MKTGVGQIVRDAVVRRHRPDYQIILYMGLLMLLGLIVMYAIGPQRANVLNNAYNTNYYSSIYFFVKQSTSLGLAAVAFIMFAVIPFDWIKKNATKVLLIGLGACVLLVITGNMLHLGSIAYCANGACRWFTLGPLGTLQPAEILKLGVLVFMAGFFGMRAKQGLINDFQRTIVPFLTLIGITAVLVVVIQKDMGTGIALMAIMMTMLIVAGVKWQMIAKIGGILLVGGILMILIAPHRLERIATFFKGDNTSASQQNSYQITHAKIAIGSGGLFGVGIGNSVEATGYLPEAINDSVFAIMGETFGFVGLTVILMLFTALLMRLIKIVDHLPDMWMRLIVAGVFGWLMAHVILNVAAMIGVFPLTGITLPLLSFGGTSMIFISAALGLAFQISRYTAHGPVIKENNEHEDISSRRRVGRTRYASRRSTPRT
ncbi:MAG: FtsW/RodA/SpoVE family cell cycle protein [Candidatus Saccharimonadales bacterium]